MRACATPKTGSSLCIYMTCPTEDTHGIITLHYRLLQLSEGGAEWLVELQRLSRAGIG